MPISLTGQPGLHSPLAETTHRSWSFASGLVALTTYLLSLSRWQFNVRRTFASWSLSSAAFTAKAFHHPGLATFYFVFELLPRTGLRLSPSKVCAVPRDITDETVLSTFAFADSRRWNQSADNRQIQPRCNLRCRVFRSAIYLPNICFQLRLLALPQLL